MANLIITGAGFGTQAPDEVLDSKTQIQNTLGNYTGGAHPSWGFLNEISRPLSVDTNTDTSVDTSTVMKAQYPPQPSVNLPWVQNSAVTVSLTNEVGEGEYLLVYALHRIETSSPTTTAGQYKMTRMQSETGVNDFNSDGEIATFLWSHSGSGHSNRVWSRNNFEDMVVKRGGQDGGYPALEVGDSGWFATLQIVKNSSHGQFDGHMVHLTGADGSVTPDDGVYLTYSSDYQNAGYDQDPYDNFRTSSGSQDYFQHVNFQGYIGNAGYQSVTSTLSRSDMVVQHGLPAAMVTDSPTLAGSSNFTIMPIVSVTDTQIEVKEQFGMVDKNNPVYFYLITGTTLPTNALRQSNDGGLTWFDVGGTPGTPPTISITSAPGDPTVTVSFVSTNTLTNSFNMGDGTPAKENQSTGFTHTYTSNGTFTITGTATNESGSVQDTLQVTISSLPPATLPTFGISSVTGDPTVTVNFIESDSTSNSFDMGDGSAPLVNQTTGFTYTYGYNSTFTITGTSTNENGSTVDSFQKQVAGVTLPVPPASISLTHDSSLDPLISFNFSVTDADVLEIDFDDGETANLSSTATSTTHTYDVNGTYTVTLTASNSSGSVQATTVVNVFNVPPLEPPIINNIVVTGDPDVTIEFDITHDTGATVYTGDGASYVSTEPEGTTHSVEHSYTSNGVYEIEIWSTNTDGTTVEKEEKVIGSFAVQTNALNTQAAVLALGYYPSEVKTSQTPVLALAEFQADAKVTQSFALALVGFGADIRVSQSPVLVLADHVPCLTRWAQCWSIKRTDGVEFYYTTADKAITFRGNVHTPCNSLAATASEMSAQAGSTGNIESYGVIHDEAITEEDLDAGLFDSAMVEVWVVPWENQGGEIPFRIMAGRYGSVTYGNASYTGEVLSDSVLMKQTPLLETYTAACRYDLGDSRCKVDLFAYQVNGQVTDTVVPTSPNQGTRRMFSDTSITEAPGYFNAGLLTWTSGNNQGTTAEVKTYDGITFVLWDVMRHTIQVGDSYTIQPGCDKSAATCKNVFNNYLNNGGFPHVPGTDAMLSAAGT